MITTIYFLFCPEKLIDKMINLRKYTNEINFYDDLRNKDNLFSFIDYIREDIGTEKLSGEISQIIYDRLQN